MPGLEPDKQETLFQLWAGAGVLGVSAVAAMWKLFRGKHEPAAALISASDNAMLVAAAKRIAELEAERRELKMRIEFDVKLQDVRQDFAEAMRAGREVFHDKLNEMASEVSEIKGMLSGRPPVRR